MNGLFVAAWMSTVVLGACALAAMEERRASRSYWERWSQHEAAVEAEADLWRKAHPELAKRGCSPPPTPLSMRVL